MATFKELVRSITSLNLAASGNNAQDAVDAIKVTPVANSASSNLVTINNAAHGQASTYTIPDSGSATANFMLDAGTTTSKTITTLRSTTINVAADAVAGTVNIFPATTASGKLILSATNSSGAFNTTITNASMGQSTVVSIPDPGAATSKFVLQDGTNTVASIANLKYGATPVAQVDPASCTISGAAGAANVCTVTVQLKDGSGTNIARSVLCRVYSSSAADGLTLQSAASTGYSMTSGGLSLQNGAAVTTQFTFMTSATGGAVLSLTDTGKQTSYLVLVLPNGNKISAQLSAGSYG